jgi:hypothetical protein
MIFRIVDTNVPLTAIATEGAPACRKACIQLIREIFNGNIVVVIDNLDKALKEYRDNMYPDPAPSAGLASQFMMYVASNRYNTTRVYQTSISQDADGEVKPFPEDATLRDFDRSDKKWVAISLSFRQKENKTAPIVNATDTDWLKFERALSELGISIELLCRDDLEKKLKHRQKPS